MERAIRRTSRCCPLLRTAIYEITNKDHLPLRISKNTVDLDVLELAQQSMQSVSMTMNVTNEIVSLDSHYIALLCRSARHRGQWRRNRHDCLPGAYPGQSRYLRL
jgi:hypothetical protein